MRGGRYGKYGEFKKKENLKRSALLKIPPRSSLENSGLTKKPKRFHQCKECHEIFWNRSLLKLNATITKFICPTCGSDLEEKISH
jgi:transcription initiation factor IIE alpha subunit